MRPWVVVVLAMSADGKIADRDRSPARFGSERDRGHLETQMAGVDGVLFGAGTLRAYGTTLPVTNPELLQQRRSQGKPEQPVHVVVSRSGKLDPNLRFFRQGVPRWLLTSATGSQRWQGEAAFEQVIVVPDGDDGLNGAIALANLYQMGLKRLAVTGGGKLVASLMAIGAIDELWLTVCPLLLGGVTAPTPVEGSGLLVAIAPRLNLLSVEQIENEVFLHYRVI
jgi:5-amino-6-(5-phosphoribosylamino)uracil reductase